MFAHALHSYVSGLTRAFEAKLTISMAQEGESLMPYIYGYLKGKCTEAAELLKKKMGAVSILLSSVKRVYLPFKSGLNSCD